MVTRYCKREGATASERAMVRATCYFEEIKTSNIRQVVKLSYKNFYWAALSLSFLVIRCMTRRAQMRGSPCIVTIVKRPWGSQRDTSHSAEPLISIYNMFMNIIAWTLQVIRIRVSFCFKVILKIIYKDLKYKIVHFTL